MPKWLLPTLSEVVALSDPTWMAGDSVQAIAAEVASSQPTAHSLLQHGTRRPALQQLRAEREWTGAIAALNELLHQLLAGATADATINLNSSDLHRDIAPNRSACSGLVLSSPSPVLSQPVGAAFSTWTLATTSVHDPNWLGLQLLPAEAAIATPAHTHPVLPLLPGDPLAAEPFCLVLTPWLSLVMVLGEGLTGEPAFMFSFVPEVVQRSWEAVRPRVLLLSSHQVDFLDDLVQQFPSVAPDFKTVQQFSRLMMAHLPEPALETQFENGTESLSQSAVKPEQREHLPLTQSAEVASSQRQHGRSQPAVEQPSAAAHAMLTEADFDVELVKALAHEVRTPLTTIRTLTRSLLKRSDLAPDVLRRLNIIDRECSEQIDRFGLIFKAVELETSATQQRAMSLIRTSLTDVLQQSIPRWQQQALQRHMTLDVVLPQRMPAVVSDPTVLDQALTSLIERFTRNLPAHSHIQVEVTLAGDQLKLQLHSQPDAAANTNDKTVGKPLSMSIGQVLTFQPETGSLSLNLSVTKNLFQAIGGKLIVKQRPQQGEVMTVYLPLEAGSLSPLDGNKIITV